MALPSRAHPLSSEPSSFSVLHSSLASFLISLLVSLSLFEPISSQTDLSYIDLHRNNQGIPKWEKAVEGISGAAVIYTAFAVIFTCFLGGVTIFSALGILLDLLFLGGFIAIAIMGRGGLRSCRGSPNSIFGQGHRNACKLEKGVFVVAVIAA